jgi:hypothetical protein
VSEPTAPTPQEQPQPPGPEGKKIGTVGLMGVGLVAVIIIVGIVVSLVVLQKDQDAPLVPVDGAASAVPSTPDPQSGLFEPDPQFDALGRVAYVPKDPNGVILEQTPPPAGRAADTAPLGVMLQRIHGNMVLPFSTSDGPTAIDSWGVATGFAHTPQGAALAAAHYMAYVNAGNDRVDMLAVSRQVDDPDAYLDERKRINVQRREGWVVDGSPAAAVPSVRVEYSETLTRVWFGYSANLNSGQTQYRRLYVDLIWRTDGRGWVLQARQDTDQQGPTIGFQINSTPFEPGWQTWW